MSEIGQRRRLGANRWAVDDREAVGHCRPDGAEDAGAGNAATVALRSGNKGHRPPHLDQSNADQHRGLGDRHPTDVETAAYFVACEGLTNAVKHSRTSHELGRNFAKAFDILYLDGDNNQQHAWTTSWGASTRMVGGLIMAHGDDNGLRIPPALAHIQAVVMVVRGSGEVDNAASKLTADIGDHGVKVRLDDRTGTPLGRRITDWELKGVPVRIEVGPGELDKNEVTIVRRDTGDKQRVSVESAPAAVAKLMDQIQDNMLAAATEFRDTNTTDATTIDEVLDASATGFAKVPWDVVAGEDAKAALVDKAVTVRCIQRRRRHHPRHRK